MEYERSFQVRASSFLEALRACPMALHNECSVASGMTRGNVIVNLAAAGIDIRPYMSNKTYLSFEMNKPFADLLNIPYCSISHIPLPDSFADTLLLIATLHHMSNDERRVLYAECMRVLKPGGRLVVGDIEKNTPPARWLDEYVHMHNPFGHLATFFDEQDQGAFEQSGFRVEVIRAMYPWVFSTRTELESFMNRLFYLQAPATLSEALDTYLSATSTTVPWQLIYFIATKPDLLYVPHPEASPLFLLQG